MEESQMLQGREEYRLYSFYLHRSHHRPIKLNVVRDDYMHTLHTGVRAGTKNSRPVDNVR